MSDTMGAADQFAAAFQGQSDTGTEGQQVSPEPTTQQQDPNQQVSYSPYAQQFLQDVPQDQRAIVEEHLRKWDAGFTRYAQGMNDQLRQYQSLGDAQQIQQAVQYYNQLLNDPHSVAELLIQNGFGPAQAQQLAQQATQQQNPQQMQQDPFQQMPEPIRQRFEAVDRLNQQYSQMERAMGLIAQKFNEQDQMAQEQAGDQQLEQLLGQMKQQFGDFDETYILTQLANGANPDQAIRNYNAFIQREVNKRAAPQPPSVISGSSLPAIKTPLDTADQRNAALTAALKGLGLGNG